MNSTTWMSVKKVHSFRIVVVAVALTTLFASLLLSTASNAEAIPNWDQVGSAPIVTPDHSTWFQVKCNFSHSNNDDPIVFPGKQGVSHSHDFFGNTGTNFATTYKTLRDTGSSSCSNTLNKSAYWTPSLFKNGVKINPIEGKFYYRADGEGNRDMQPFPAGLRMIAGNAKATSATPQSTGIVNWKCGTGNVYKVNNSAGIPTCTGTDVLHMWVTFPNCWNGKDLDSPDHKSHMAYSDKATGRCLDPNFPVRVPRFLQIYKYQTTGGVNGGYTLGMPMLNEKAANPTMTGSPFSGHADFFSAWDQDEQARLMHVCIWKQLWCDSNGVASSSIKTGSNTAFNPGTNWPPAGVKPYITQQPVPTQTAFADNAGVLAVNATGSLPIAYQWYKNGIPIAGATGQAYIVSKPSSLDKYSVRATNGWGTSTSQTASVYPNTTEPTTTTTTTSPTVTTRPTNPSPQQPTVITCVISVDAKVTPDVSKLVAPAYLRINANVNGIKGTEIDRVELLLNGNVLATEKLEPYVFSIGGIRAGSKQYQARVIPKTGNPVLSNIIKLVVNDLKASDVVAPSAVGSLKANVSYEAVAKRNLILLSWSPATDNSGTIAKYRVYKSGSLLRETTSLSITNYIYAAGVHDYRVVAVDYELHLCCRCSRFSCCCS